MAIDKKAFAASKSYTNQVALGIGSMRVEDTTVYFTILDTGEEVGVTLPTPKDGVSITAVDVDNNNYLVCIFSDGTITKSTNPIEIIVESSSGEDNKINSISVNGTEITPDTNKNVDITIPDAHIQSISQDGTPLPVDENGNVDISIADTNKIEVVKQNGVTLNINPTDKSVDVKADVNTIEVVKVNGASLNIDKTDKSVDIKIHTHDNKSVLDNITLERTEQWDMAEENAQSNWEQTDDTADDFIKNKPEFQVMTEEELLEKLGLSEEELQGLAQLISDTEVRIDKTYSSSKIYNELNRVLEEGKTYTLAEIAKSSGASYKIASSTTEMTSTKYIYLLANGDTYDMYICEEENSTPVKIGTTSVTLTDYYTKTECDERYVLATAFELLNNSIGDVNNLQTTSKVVVDAINEVSISVNEISTTVTETKEALGDISALETTAKDNVVNAVNEVKKTVDELEPYTEVTQEEYDAIDNKMDDVEYRTTDTGHIYKNNVEYGRDAAICSTAPIGTVLSFAGNVAPNGYLLCNGQSVAVAKYPELYVVIGNTYGGDAENFNVPNLVDKFIQGSTTSGTEKEAGLPNITGSIGSSGSANDQFLSDSTSASITTNGALSITGYASKTSMANGSDSYNIPTGFGFDASRSNAIYGNSDTVQPPALTMVYIIKAFHTNEGVDTGVSDEVVNYVDNKLDGLISDTSTNSASTWSSSKITEYVAQNAPAASGTVTPTSIASGASVTTNWNIQSAGNNAEYGRLLMLNSKDGTFLIYVKGNLGSTSTVPTPILISSIGNSQSASWSSSFELSISSGKLRIKNKSGAVASWRFV